MRLAVFSDIHSNSVALETCINYADHVGVDGYVFLGDHLTDCPYPQRTLRLIRSAGERRPSWCLRGNREDYLLAHAAKKGEEWTPSSQYGSLLYTYQNLSEHDLAYLRAMPITDLCELPGCPPIRLCHAAPQNNSVMLYPGAEPLEAVMRAMREDTLLTGHNHFQYRYESRGRQAVNPGSAGMNCHGQTKAQFALLSCLGGRWSARLMNVEYDRMEILRQFEESGLLDMAGVWARAVMRTLREGGNWTMECMLAAKKLAQGGPATEVCWEAAARKLGV